MPTLSFPTDHAVGTLDFVGASDTGRAPTLAIGDVLVPDRAISLNVFAVGAVEQQGAGWSLESRAVDVDLAFVRQLPPAAIASLTLGDQIVPSSVRQLVHLAPGLRKLYVARAGLADDALPTIAALVRLTYLQTWGNRFSDDAVQQLVALQELVNLYLEEETLGPKAFAFATRLPALERLGLQDVAISDAELDELRARLPGVQVGR